VAVAVDIREERPADIPAIREVNRLAFRQGQEGELIDSLRVNGGVLLSLVAISHGQIVGHILYTPIVVGDRFIGAALGPIAVHPDYQRQGIGSELIKTGNRQLEDAGCAFIIVVGHAEFYPRFGFRPARPLGITCEWEVPDDVFMVLIIDQSKTAGMSGLAQYRSEFSRV
jgi:putative acetyltransferase